MFSVVVFLFRLVVGFVVLFAVWFVLDTIRDRNTEIIVAVIGLLYAFIFVISRRLQYFGLTIFTYFGRAAQYVRHEPYDRMLRDETELHAPGQHLYLNVLFAALIEVLCLYRLFSSLLGHGWGLLADPVHSLLESARF
jgi:hypothetical protein